MQRFLLATKSTERIWASNASSAIRGRRGRSGRRCPPGRTAWTATICRFRKLRRGRLSTRFSRTLRNPRSNSKAAFLRPFSFRTEFTRRRTSPAKHATEPLRKSMREGVRKFGCRNVSSVTGARAVFRKPPRNVRGVTGENFQTFVSQAFGRYADGNFPLWMPKGKRSGARNFKSRIQAGRFAPRKGNCGGSGVPSAGRKSCPDSDARRTARPAVFEGSPGNGN